MSDTPGFRKVFDKKSNKQKNYWSLWIFETWLEHFPSIPGDDTIPAT